MPTNPELLLLSAVVRTGDHKSLVKTAITPDMFHSYPDAGKWTFAYITRHGRAPSRTALSQKFPGIRLYRTDDVEYYADEVRKQHVRHALLSTLDVATMALEEGDQDKALAIMQSGVMEAQVRSMGVSESFDAFADWGQTYNDVALRVDRVAKNGTAGIPSGFDTLDDITGGFQPGWFCVIAARLGQGKTWTGIRMAFAAAVLGAEIEYYSMEQGRHQVAMRMHTFASAHYGQQVFNSLDLSRGRGFDLREYKKFLRNLKEQIGEGKFFINDTSRGKITAQTLAARCEAGRIPDIMFLDYLTLMGTRGEDWRATAALSADVQAVAQRYGVAVVAAAQVNRLGNGKEPPNAEHLSQADAIGHDADMLVTMARQSTHVMKMKLAKFRHGPDGMSWYTKFSPGTGQYVEITGDEAEEQREKDQELD